QHLTDDELRAKTAEFKAKIREVVAPIEAEQAEVRARLKAAQSATADEVGGDGQAAPGAAERLSVRERQDLYQQLEDLEDDWLDAAEDALESVMTEAFAVVKETCRRFLGKAWEAGGSEIEWQMVPFD